MDLAENGVWYDTEMLDEDTPLPGDNWAVDLEDGNVLVHILRVTDTDVMGAPAAYMVLDDDANAFELTFDDIVTAGEKVN